MKIHVLPISGGGFVSQLGVYYMLSQVFRCKPDVSIGSSGGNIVAYIGMAADWRPERILETAGLINSTLFVQSWTPDFFPTWILFPVTQSVYRSAGGIERFFKTIFTPVSIRRTEIYTGTFNTSNERNTVFCNRTQSDSLLKYEPNDRSYEKSILDTDPVVYLEGDLKLISNAVYASASIPYITQGVVIKGDVHIDGGSMYASPLISMTKMIERYFESNPDELVQMTYFCSYNMETLFGKGIVKSISTLIHSLVLQDRNLAIVLFEKIIKRKSVYKRYHKVDMSRLKSLFSPLENRHYLAILSPHESSEVNVTKFTGNDVKSIVEDTNTCQVYIWV